MRWRRFTPLLTAALLAVTFGWILGPDVLAAARSYSWTATPCRILKSEVAEEAYSPSVTHFVLKVEYDYEFAGRTWRSHRFTTGSRQGSTDLSKAERYASRYAPGVQTRCYVNPDAPSEAVLERGELWGGLFLLAPVLILGLMEHETIFAWMESRRRRRASSRNLPLSESNEAIRSDGRHLFFGGLGLILGVFFLTFCLAAPLWRWRQARSWDRVPCVLTRNELTQRTGQHGPEYELQLAFEYQYGGRSLRSGKPGLWDSLDRPVADLARWVAEHPVGTRTEAFVNPAEPTDAILDRGLHLGWIGPGLGMGMVSLGIVLLRRARRGMRERGSCEGADLYAIAVGRFDAGPRVFETGRHRIPMLLGLLLLAVPPAAAGAWSLSKSVQALRGGQGDVMNALYGGAAGVLAGWLLQNAWKRFRRTARPDLRVELTPGTPVVGQPFTLSWTLTRRARQVTAVRCHLEGREEVLVRQTTPGLHGAVSEEKPLSHGFEPIPVGETPTHAATRGSFDGRTPPDLMHSLHGLKASVIWDLVVELHEPGLPPQREVFRIRLLPGT